jgi:hypothetical protein
MDCNHDVSAPFPDPIAEMPKAPTKSPPASSTDFAENGERPSYRCPLDGTTLPLSFFMRFRIRVSSKLVLSLVKRTCHRESPSVDQRISDQ